MKLGIFGSAVLLGLSGVTGMAFAQAQTDAGKQEYEWHCAICHGESGRGDGEMRKFLTTAPADLTQISKRNGGTFPNQLIWDIIDGRAATEAGAHGTREMPVWGQRYRQEAMADPGGAAAPEWAVRNRIVALLDYLSRIQEK